MEVVGREIDVHWINRDVSISAREVDQPTIVKDVKAAIENIIEIKIQIGSIRATDPTACMICDQVVCRGNERA